MSNDEKKLTAVENIKGGSDYLRGDIKRDLEDTAKSHFDEQEIQLMKHHGIYQQDDRDLRRERRKQKLDKAWSFMVRTRCPGGRMTSEAYLGLDKLCEQRGNDSLRVTTRQGFQFHGVGKENLATLIRELNELSVTTLAACGDVARNVMASPVSDIDPESPANMRPLAEKLSRHFLPRTDSYFDVWVDGEKLDSGHFEGEFPEPVLPTGNFDGPEPLYGPNYMPRKFKVGIATAEDNHVDLYTQDIGIEVIPDGQGGHAGFNILAGGGLGASHAKAETYPRVADRFAFVETEDEVMAICEAILKVQRDYGDRTNRKHARMKYLIADWGLERFREAVENFLGAKTTPAKPPTGSGQDYRLGWRRQKQGQGDKQQMWYVGVRVENGRVRDFDGGPQLRAGFSAILKEFPGVEIRMTAHHNIILAHIPDAAKTRVEELMAKHAMSDGSDLSALRNQEMACPALPTCGLALAEAERYLPSLISELEEAGYGDESISIRMSGCPNSCSRAPSAEIGLLGRAPGKYNVYLGGNKDGSRYNWLWKESVPDAELCAEIGGVIDQWRTNGKADGTDFGDWADAHKDELISLA